MVESRAGAADAAGSTRRAQSSVFSRACDLCGRSRVGGGRRSMHRKVRQQVMDGSKRRSHAVEAAWSKQPGKGGARGLAGGQGRCRGDAWQGGSTQQGKGQCVCCRPSATGSAGTRARGAAAGGIRRKYITLYRVSFWASIRHGLDFFTHLR